MVRVRERIKFRSEKDISFMVWDKFRVRFRVRGRVRVRVRDKVRARFSVRVRDRVRVTDRLKNSVSGGSESGLRLVPLAG